MAKERNSQCNVKKGRYLQYRMCVHTWTRTQVFKGERNTEGEEEIESEEWKTDTQRETERGEEIESEDRTCLCDLNDSYFLLLSYLYVLKV